LIGKARTAGSPYESADHLRNAMALWRGQPLADVRGETWFGEHAELIPDLEGLTRQAPFDEDLHGQLMLALYRCGRQADALAAYQQIRRRLGDELGLDPGPRLRDLEHAILRHVADLDHRSH
jgi:DNA-binding SARP family transcriptional activator